MVILVYGFNTSAAWLCGVVVCNQLALSERKWKRPRLMTLWGEISLSRPLYLSPLWNHGGVSVSAWAVSLLIVASHLLSHSAPGYRNEGREGERKHKQEIGPFLVLTQQMSSTSTPLKYNWNSQRSRGESWGHLLPPRNQLYNHQSPPVVGGLVQSTAFSWQADRVSWSTGQHWAEGGIELQTCTTSRVTLDLWRLCTSEWAKQTRGNGMVERLWGFYEHATVIEI